jgi:4-hydroxy-3-polyprenylbenzoate decarboxylase
VPRETPLSELHLENMLKLARLGAIVLPAMPGFYHRPQTVQDLVDFVVGKILDRLRVEHALLRRWQTPAPKPPSPWHEGEDG